MDIKFRKEQKKILRYKSGLLGIPAVPGAGKTFILAHLSAKLVKRLEREESKLLILTYMNSAVNNIKMRLKELLNEEELKRVEVKTIHSLASEIIHENLDRVNIESNYKLMNNSMKNYLMTIALEKYLRESSKDLLIFLKKGDVDSIKKFEKVLVITTLNVISYCKNLSISLDKLYSKTKKYRKDSSLRVVGELYKRYDKELKIRGVLDYDDLLSFTYNLLKGDSDLVKRYRERYTFILEDETQDSNILQNRIIKLINRDNLVRVGDLNQSIMGTFTSSYPYLFKNFLKGAHVEPLFKSNRSSRDIIELANYFLEWTRKSHPLIEVRKALENQKIVPCGEGEFPENPKVDGYGIRVLNYKNRWSEKDEILDIILRFQNRFPEKTVGVLLPDNRKIEDLAKELRKKDIEFRILSDTPESIREGINYISAILDYVAEPYNNFKLLHLFNNHYYKIEKDEDRENFNNYILGVALELLIFDRDSLLIPKSIDEDRVFSEFLNFLKRIEAMLEYKESSLEKFLIFISEVFEFEDEKVTLITKISSDLSKILKLNPKWELKDVAANLKIAKDSQFSYLAKSTEIENGIVDKDEKKIILTTYHKSKGLEWDLVIMGSLDNFNFPAYLNDEGRGKYSFLNESFEYFYEVTKYELEKEFLDKSYRNPITIAKVERISERVRLLYVGITRAKEYLIISGDKNSIYLKELKKFIERKRRENNE